MQQIQRMKSKKNILSNDSLISIITTSYNYQDYIKETIESVLAQTYTNWEMIIVDDGSKDDSVNVINCYCQKDNRIKLFQHENGINKGLTETIKLGLEKAKSDWVVFLESDDSITPNYLQEKINVIEKNPDVKFIFNALNCFGDEKRISFMSRYFKKQRKILNKHKCYDNFFVNFEHCNVVPTFSCVMTKKELFEGLDFDSPNKTSIDWLLWTQIAKITNFYYIDKPLTNWRLHTNSYIGESTNIIDIIKLKFKILKIIYFEKNKFLYYSKGTVYSIKRAIKFLIQCIILLYS